METRFAICDKVVFLNTTTKKVEEGEVTGIEIVATDIKKNEKGENELKVSMVLYKVQLGGRGLMLSEAEVFGSKEELVEVYRAALAQI